MISSVLAGQEIKTLFPAANPYGLAIGPDGAIYYCEIDLHRISRLDMKTLERTTVAGTDKAGYTGDGGLAIAANMNQPYEIAFSPSGDLYEVEMPNHIVRKIDKASGVIRTIAGTGAAGFAGDGGPANLAQFKQPHSLALLGANKLLICDIGNNRVRGIDLANETVSTYAGTGKPGPTAEGAAAGSVALNGPRALGLDRSGNLYIVVREGNAIFRVDAKTQTISRFAGTGEKGYSGDGGPALQARFNGPKGISAAADGSVYVADTENHVIRRIDNKGMIGTVAGTGERGDGPDGDPLQCKLSRPHGVFAAAGGIVYISDSESNRIRVLVGRR